MENCFISLSFSFLIHKIKVEQIPYCRMVLKKNEMTPEPLKCMPPSSKAALHLPDRAEAQHGTMVMHCVDSVSSSRIRCLHL